jgi:hypothetical protein
LDLGPLTLGPYLLIDLPDGRERSAMLSSLMPLFSFRVGEFDPCQPWLRLPSA